MKLYETISAENWCKGNFSVDRNGRRVDMENSSAVRWCLEGHLRNSSDLWSAAKWIDVEQAILALYPERASGMRASLIPDFNDHKATTLDDVLRVCKFADV